MGFLQEFEVERCQVVRPETYRGSEAFGGKQDASTCHGERLREGMARKLIGFDPETLQALELLSKDARRFRIHEASSAVVASRMRVVRPGRRLRSAPLLSPCRLWFADNCHINVRRRPRDVHSLALSDRGLRITRRNVYDPTIIRRRAIVLALGGEGGDRKAKHECGDEKKLSHLATFPFSAS